MREYVYRNFIIKLSHFPNSTYSIGEETAIAYYWEIYYQGNKISDNFDSSPHFEHLALVLAQFRIDYYLKDYEPQENEKPVLIGVY